MAALAFFALFTGATSFSVPAFGEEPPVGIISILSGEYSDAGVSILRAAELAVTDYNAKNHTALKLIAEDDGAQAAKGLSAFRKLRDIDHANPIFVVSTFTIGAVKELVNRARQITFILGNEPHDPADDFIFQVTPGAVPASAAYGREIRKLYPEGEIVVVSSENGALKRIAEAIVPAIGGTVFPIELTSNEQDLRSIALTIQKRKPTAIVFVSLPKASAELVKILSGAGPLPPLFFDESIQNSAADVRAVLGNTKILHGSKILKVSKPLTPQFIERFTKLYATPPRPWDEFGYDAMTLALEFKGIQGEEGKAKLLHGKFSGVSGEIEFDGTGVRKPWYEIRTLGENLEVVP